VFTRARAGDWEGARSFQLRINELIRIGIRFPVFAAIKAMLEWSGTDCGRVLPPRRSLTAAEEAELRGLLAASSFAEAPLAGGAAT
jgi:dihydrodipicolinate synthase/N-acetylneuraminate lyase